jgi:hypothetical protein
MRKCLLISATLVAVVAVTAIFAPSALSGSGAHDRHGAQLIHITSATAQEAFIDVAPADVFSVGDSYVFSEDLFAGTKRIGDSGGECTTVRIESASSAVAKCTETFRLPDGQIVTQGLVTFDPAVGGTAFTWAVTGGTGAYNTAHGEVSAVESNGGANATFDFRITR